MILDITFMVQLGDPSLRSPRERSRQRQHRSSLGIAWNDELLRQSYLASNPVCLFFEPFHTLCAYCSEVGGVFRCGGYFCHDIVQVALDIEQCCFNLIGQAKSARRTHCCAGFIDRTDCLQPWMVFWYAGVTQ